MLAETLQVIDADSSLWPPLRPLLDAALRLEQHGEEYHWHGWQRRSIEAFLRGLPEHCSLVIGVWESQPPDEGEVFGAERMLLGAVCEVARGEVQSIRTLESLAGDSLKPVVQLEPGLSDALDIMRAAKNAVAPVAWALFTDCETWNAWVFGEGEEDEVAMKEELLADYAQRGRCVLLGSQAAREHPRTD